MKVEEGGVMPANRRQGSEISELRRRLNMTQEEFAHTIGVTVSTVNRWENGHIEPSRLARRALDTLAGQVPPQAEQWGFSTPLNAKASDA